MSVTTHVLDLSRGCPAAGVDVVLHGRAAGGWSELARRRTDDDGRVTDLLPSGGPATPGVYRLTFATAEYFDRLGVASFHPTVEICFRITDAGQHYHVPLLLSPFGYSTYRGS